MKHHTFPQSATTTDTIDKIFAWILSEAAEAEYLKPEAVFIDGTHIKANANTKKKIEIEIPVAAKRYADELLEEINNDRVIHVKRPFEDDDTPKTGGKKKTIH